MNIDKVAEAIRGADEGAGEYEFPIGGSVWYNRLARAAVESLGLTEEWTWSWPNSSAPGVPGYGYSVSSYDEAASEGGDVVSRLVSPWVKADQ